MKSPKLPDHQYQVLRAIYDWRVTGRRAVEGKKRGQIEVFDGVPIYFIQAQFEGSEIDVKTTHRLLEIKKLVQPPGHSAHYDGAWELPDGRVVAARTRAFENDPHSFVIICALRTDLYLDGCLIKRSLDHRRTDLTDAGLELIENAPHHIQKGQSRIELRKRAECYVKSQGDIFPGVRALAKILTCPESSLSNAIKDSTYLRARKAEHQKRIRTASTQTLSEYDFDQLKQSTEPDPSDALDDLVAEQQADLRKDSRRSRRSDRRS